MGNTRGSEGMAGTLTYLSMSANALHACTWYIRHVNVFRRMTPFDANEDPAPVEVLYDWKLPGQRSRLFLPRGTGAIAQDALGANEDQTQG